MESLSRLEERIQKAADLIARLRQENKRLEQMTTQLQQDRHALERRADDLGAEKQELVNEGRLCRARGMGALRARPRESTAASTPCWPSSKAQI
jgi:FtsZ-binding cell division protein ZapB